ncbi:peptidyl-prolyl cis-trans isomerase B (cyclophilin B) [Streptohalobacillus salinus]|uniref:Peptidyl-prolyl cis-trans isomerase n=1 Tax=Streptohalobacillus salinus TaxID=621096 RepID=A0A2V3WBH8_9BACI|nr:peptidylprolyl isomerase [Streptohalobacillus salinus]PXW86089.1 peptidyl-prolyl cis-trans isomerase B (cyclophilin B) [Streptohalobacillus salinus]
MYNKKMLLISLGLLLFILVACQNTSDKESAETKQIETGEPKANETKEPTIAEDKFPQVTITMETGEAIVFELYPNAAPNTVRNFISLIDQSYYDGLIFHRVIEDFMIHGGDPYGNGLGGPDYSIRGEFSANGFDNPIKHERGVISMARSQSPDSAGSQFFIVHKDSTHLDGQYAAFGKVIEGLDVIDRIAAVNTDNNDLPLDDEVMRSITVDKKGITYDTPEYK